MQRTTTKQLAARYQELADNSSHKNGLWKTAYEWTSRILRTYHRSRAMRMLDSMAIRYRSMSISSVFAGAANSLREECGQ